jgi:formate hydrogenlyase subunit 3/multisubunit Na+/H+ antiporter MnhD subunit
MQIPMIILAAACVFMGLLLVPSVRALVLEPAVEIILDPSKYIELVTGAMG